MKGDNKLEARPDGAVVPVAASTRGRARPEAGQVDVRHGDQGHHRARRQEWRANPERRKVTMPVEVTDGRLTIVPDQKLLTDPAARFPIEIDPDWSSGRNAWALIYQQHPADHYWFGDGDGIAKVGYCGDWEWPTVTVRSYFQFDVWALGGKDRRPPIRTQWK
jgi:hypothetical protein